MTTSTSRSDAYLSADREQDRLVTLRATYVLDSTMKGAFEALAEMARLITGASISLVSLVGETRQFFKAAVGTNLTGSDRKTAFCAHAIEADEIFEVCNAIDDRRFQHNPLVTGYPNIRYYFGVPIHGFTGLPIGTLCVIDDKPRLPLRESEREALIQLAASVESIIDHGRNVRMREAQLADNTDRFLPDRTSRVRGLRASLDVARQEFEKIEALLAREAPTEAIRRAAARGLAASSAQTLESELVSPWDVLIDTIIESLQGHAAEREVELDFESRDIDESMPPANAARTLLSLIRTSIDHSAPGSQVGIRIKSGPYFVSVSIYREVEGVTVYGADEAEPLTTIAEVRQAAQQALIANGGHLEEKPWTGGAVLKLWYPHPR